MATAWRFLESVYKELARLEAAWAALDAAA